MVIALDYDGTYDQDRVLWLKLTAAAMERGHKVVCVTARRPNDRIDEEMPIPVYYTDRAAKRWYMKEVAKVKVDVWVDDSPEHIVNGV
jgi:glutamate formiminotransferase